MSDIPRFGHVDATDGESEVKHEDIVEGCVKHPEAKGVYEMRGNAGRLFLHVNSINGLVDPVSSKRSRGETTCTKQTVSCSFPVDTSKSGSCVIATKMDGPKSRGNFALTAFNGVKRVCIGEGCWFVASWRSW